MLYYKLDFFPRPLSRVLNPGGRKNDQTNAEPPPHQFMWRRLELFSYVVRSMALRVESSTSILASDFLVCGTGQIKVLKSLKSEIKHVV